MRIHLIDEDIKLCRDLENIFTAEGMSISCSHDGIKSIIFLLEKKVDLLLFDINHAKAPGVDLLKRISSEFPLLPVVILTENNNEEDKVKCFELGVEDYILKPFNKQLLISRIKSVIKKRSLYNKNFNKESFLHSEKWKLTLYQDSRRVMLEEKTLDLTGAEFRILSFLMENQGKVKSRNQIIDNVKDENSDIYDRTIDSQISKIRKKLGNPGIIKTIYGNGYLLS